MIYGSVCSGIEAASVAWAPLGWRAAWFAETDPFCREVLAQRWPGVPNLGDMTAITEESLNGRPAVDVLVGGTPCQSFSVAGLRGGLDDDRGNLALEFLRLAGRLRPRWLVWENVPGVFSSLSHDAPDRREPGHDLGGPDGPRDGEEVVVSDSYDAEEAHAFGRFLAGLSELRYGFAYRVLDAQYVRVESHPRAVPQRRRRVFLVGYLGDWRPAVAVLLEPESLRGDSPPRREAGQDVAGTLVHRAQKGGGFGTDFDCAGGLVSGTVTRSLGVGGADVARAENLVAGTLDAHYGAKHGHDNQHIDGGASLFVLSGRAPPLGGNHYGDRPSQEGLLVAHSLTADGFDASDDGTGRGTPIIAFSCKDSGLDAGEVAPTLRALSHDRSHANAGGQVAVMEVRGRGDGRNRELRRDGAANALRTPSGGRDGIGVGAIHSGSTVRRLTPRECERLMGFPDDYTLVSYRGRPAADGPRYRALGNSMAINCMSWIGQRMALFEKVAGRLK